jgi:tetratricopeptide (TPR) repeat protein
MKATPFSSIKFSLKKEIPMNSYAFRIGPIVLLLVVCLFAHGQTPLSAVNKYNDGLSKLNKRDFDGAIRELTEAIELSSRLVPPKSSKSSFWNNTVAESDSSRITGVDPFTANAYTDRGVARYRKGDLEGALQDFNWAIRIRPSLFVAYVNRGAVRRALGDLASALQDLDRAISLQSDVAEAYNNRGSLRYDLDDTDGALSDLNKGIELNSRVPQLFYHRGFVFIRKHEFDRALSDFDRAIQLDPNIARAYEGRATAWMSKAEINRAIADFNRALERDRSLASAYLNRGLALMLKGRDLEAQNDFERCLALEPHWKSDLDRRRELARCLRAGRSCFIPK